MVQAYGYGNYASLYNQYTGAAGGAGATTPQGFGQPATQLIRSNADLANKYFSYIDNNGNANNDKALKAFPGGGAVAANVNTTLNYAMDFVIGYRDEKNSAMYGQVGLDLSKPGDTFAAVAAAYKNDGGNYNNGKLKDILEKAGRKDLANQKGVGDKDVQTLSAVRQALNDGSIKLSDVFNNSKNDAVDDDGKYQKAIEYVTGGNFAQDAANLAAGNYTALHGTPRDVRTGNIGGGGNNDKKDVGGGGNNVGGGGNNVGGGGNNVGGGGNNGAAGTAANPLSALANANPQGGIMSIIMAILQMLIQLLSGQSGGANPFLGALANLGTAGGANIGGGGNNVGGGGNNVGGGGNNVGGGGNNVGGGGNNVGGGGNNVGGGGNNVGGGGNNVGGGGNNVGGGGNNDDRAHKKD